MPPSSSSAQLSTAAGTLPSPPPLQLAQVGDRLCASLGCPAGRKPEQQGCIACGQLSGSTRAVGAAPIHNPTMGLDGTIG